MDSSCLEEGGLGWPLWEGPGRSGVTHHLQDISRDHLHAAHGCGQCAHDGGEDVEGTHAEEEILKEKKEGKGSVLPGHPEAESRAHSKPGAAPHEQNARFVCGCILFTLKISL